ncbi:MAG: hypothetical protein PHI18_06295 [bacterium]|nr:hypothetical protein [bacterium]
MSDITQRLTGIEDEIEREVKAAFTEFAGEIASDAKSFYRQVKADIENWSRALLNGHLKRDDFGWLLLAKKDGIRLHALTNAGKTLAQLDKIKAKVVDIIIKLIFSRLLP